MRDADGGLTAADAAARLEGRPDAGAPHLWVREPRVAVLLAVPQLLEPGDLARRAGSARRRGRCGCGVGS